MFRFDYTEKKTGKRKGRPLDFMGFQFYHDKTILRESIMLSCTRKVNRVAKKEKITWYDATAILSYMGYLSNTDTYDMYLQRVKPYVNVKKLKKIVSKHSKRKEPLNKRQTWHPPPARLEVATTELSPPKSPGRDHIRQTFPSSLPQCRHPQKRHDVHRVRTHVHRKP